MSRQPRRLLGALLFTVAAVVLAGSWPLLAPDTAPRPLIRMVDAAWRAVRPAPTAGPPIEIAVAVDRPGPGGGESAIVNGVRLLVEEVNAAGGIGGRPLRVAVHDDGGEPGAGQTTAEWIATETDAVAVVGHRQSEIAAPAGVVYAAARLPAITPTATAPGVTAGNPWYFRSIPDDRFLARFLAQYLDTVVDPAATVVVLGDHGNGARLATAFVEAAGELGLKIAGPVALDLAGSDAGASVERIFGALRAAEGKTALLLASHPEDAAPLVAALRKAGLEEEVTILASAMLENAAFGPGAGTASEEAARGVGYPEGMVLVTPVVFDAGPAARAFRDAYVRRHGRMPDWRAASAYDAAMALAEAIRRSGAAALGVPVADMRAAVRDRLAAMDSAAAGIAGITGPLFFDPDGNARKLPSVALYRGDGWLFAFDQVQLAGGAPAAGSPGRVVVTDSLLPMGLAGPVLLIAATLFLVTLAAGALRPGRAAITMALVQFLALCGVLAAGQDLLLGLLDARVPAALYPVAGGVAASAWPVALAGYAAFAVNRLVWPPLEARTTLAVPRSIRRLVWAVALLFGLCGVLALGLDRPAAGLFAALLLAALIGGAAFAARITDPIAALTLSAAPAFAPGDWVRIGDLPAARVSRVTWRAVRLRDGAGRRYSVPNGEVAGLTIENLSAARPLQESITVYTTPEAPPATVLELIKESLDQCSQLERGAGYGAVLCGLEVIERMMLMKYRAWYHVAELEHGPQARQEIWLNIWERLESEGIGSQPDQAAAEEPGTTPTAEPSLAEPRSA